MCCDHAPFQTATNVNRYLTITVHLHTVFTEEHMRTIQYFSKMVPGRFQALSVYFLPVCGETEPQLHLTSQTQNHSVAFPHVHFTFS